MCSDESDWTCLQPGFPIRKSTDHSLVIDSPWLIADSYVLLRFLVPRHPPCALKNLIRKDKDARVHCVVLNIRAAHHHALQCLPNTHPPGAELDGSPAVTVLTGYRPDDPSLTPEPSGPNNVSGADPTHHHVPHPPPTKGSRLYLRAVHETTPNNRCSTLEHLPSHRRGRNRAWTTKRGQCSLERR